MAPELQAHEALVQVVDAEQLKPGRTFVVGALQGGYYTLLELLERAKFDFRSDNLFHVGDVIGPLRHSDALLQLLRRHGVAGPAGSAEQALLRGLQRQEAERANGPPDSPPARPASPADGTSAAAKAASALSAALLSGATAIAAAAQQAPATTPPAEQQPVLKPAHLGFVKAMPSAVVLQPYGLVLKPAMAAAAPPAAASHPEHHTLHASNMLAGMAVSAAAPVVTSLGAGAASGLLTCVVLPPAHAVSPALRAKVAQGVAPTRDELRLLYFEEPVSDLDLPPKQL